LAQVTPFPDFDINLLFQKDYTTPPHYLVYSARLTFPVPVWDQNKGNIRQANGLLIQATQTIGQNQLALINTLADAFNRYRTTRQQVQISSRQIEDQVRAYRPLYERHWQAPDQVAFGDLVTAQQTLVGYISAYITALGAQWTAVVDVANLLQTDDLFQVGSTQEMTPVPDLDQLLMLPCCSPRGALCTGGGKFTTHPSASMLQTCSQWPTPAPACQGPPGAPCKQDPAVSSDPASEPVAVIPSEK
jgi:cobalt-zinc-cadmium efflux system outer membrane protein